jgi:hypothetical protein
MRKHSRMSGPPGSAGHRQALRHSPPRRGQSFLGATASLAIVGAILLYYTNSLASRCKADLASRSGHAVCAGLPGLARHVQLPVTVAVIVCVGIFAVTFVWSLLWA